MKETFTTDPYFKDLTNQDILELAKKSIRLTKQHSADMQKIEDLYDRIECLDSELREVISVLLKASPTHYRWVEKNFKEYIK